MRFCINLFLVFVLLVFSISWYFSKQWPHLYLLSITADQPGQNCTGDSEGFGEASPGTHELERLHPYTAYLPGKRWEGKFLSKNRTDGMKVHFFLMPNFALVFRLADTRQSQRLLCHVHDSKLWLCFAPVAQRPEEATDSHSQPRTVHEVATRVLRFYAWDRNWAHLCSEIDFLSKRCVLLVGSSFLMPRK